VIVAARNEADRIEATLDALARAMPEARVLVADDASTDGTAEIAAQLGVRVVRGDRSRGKGANVTAAAEALFADRGVPETVLLCDADLGASAAELRSLVEAVESGECDLAVAAFSRRVGGGVGAAVGFARWAIERLTGRRLAAPISGQRAMGAEVLRDALPLASGFGMEVGMTVDALRAGRELREIELDLEHRATHRDLGGFVHRGRQLRDFARVYISRRSSD
jgi:glycosyltransferase involved in cell wall biosynthesis